MSTLIIGLNYRTAPVEVRERLAFTREGVATALLLFRKQFPRAEAAILSTCNRVELLVNGDAADLDAEDLVTFLAKVRDVPVEAFRPHLYRIDGVEAIRHAFRVISGLDSMVVGECQIVNQLKQAYQLACEQETAGPVLHRLFHHAFGVSKRVRTETTISDGKTSIPSVAVDCIRGADGDFARRRILIVGAGEMARLTAEYLREASATQFIVTTRTLANAKALAGACNGTAVAFAELDEQLALADIVVTATNSPIPILTLDRARKMQESRGSRPVLLVDLSVPRNVEPEAGALPGVRLFDVDALGGIVAEARLQRTRQLETCEHIIEEEVQAFCRWLQESKARPLIEQMVEDVRALAAIEVRGFLRRCPDLTQAQQQAVEQLADRIVNKLMHPCVCTVRQHSTSDSVAALAEAFHGTRLNFANRAAAADN